MLTYAALVAALLVSSTARPAAASVDMTQYMLDHPDYCMSSMQAPKNQRALEFCTWYNDRSCCMPATDVLAEEAFSTAASLGAGCSPTDHRLRLSYREIRQFACLPCDPMEPRYRVDLSVGDTASGGEIAADASATAGTYVWRVCKSFIVGKDGKGGLWGGDGSKFDGCGLNVQPDCSGDPAFAQTGVITGADVTLNPAPSCDPRFVIPSIEFSNESATDLPQVLADALPSWLDGFSVRVVDDTAVGFSYDATPCFRGSAAARGLVIVVAAAMVTLFSMML